MIKERSLLFLLISIGLMGGNGCIACVSMTRTAWFRRRAGPEDSSLVLSGHWPFGISPTGAISWLSRAGGRG